MKIVYLKPFERLLYFTMSDYREYKAIKRKFNILSKFGFSLIEMLMALLVASLLMAALAPVMTRKMNENINISSTGGIIPQVFCAYVNNGNELLIKDTETEGCVVPDSTYSMSVIMASGGGGGAGAVDSITSSETPFISSFGGINAANSVTYEETIQNFDKSYKDFKVKMISGGGGSGGGNYGEAKRERPKNQSDCEPFGVYVSASQNGGNAICVSKYNPGENRDGSPPSDVSGVMNVPVGTNCTGGNCCWYGKTSDNCTAGKGGMEYDGCNRRVCQWNAANTICKNWVPITGGNNGRLPAAEEMNSWKISQSGSYPGINNWYPNTDKRVTGDGYGLQFCSAYAKVTTGCDQSSKCNGANGNFSFNANICYPYVVWSSTSTTWAHISGYPGSDTWSVQANQASTLANSVRCVIDNVLHFNPLQGGSSSFGNTIEISIPDNILALATTNGNGKIRTLAGYGGKGAEKETGNKGIDGSPSWIGVYDGENLLWALLLPGGNAGYGASKTEAGKNADEPSSICTFFDSTNSKYNNPNGVQIECNKIPSVTSFTRGAVSNAGTTCTFDSNQNKAVCSNGNSGGAGKVAVVYKKFYPGIGGGGGSAGTVAHFKNIQVRPKDLIKVTTGHGGKGGNMGADGENGGNSIFEITRDGKTVSKYEILGGGGGYAAKQADVINNKPAEISKAGSQSGLSSATKGKLSSSDEYYPKDSKDTIGTTGIFSTDMETSTGGNGGINPKISPLAATDGNLNGIPCGGLSNKSIVVNDNTSFDCANVSNIPLSLSRVLSESSFNASIISDLAAGSTGGGGGGWKYGADTQASGGAKGMGGYVFIYFGDWSPKQQSGG